MIFIETAILAIILLASFIIPVIAFTIEFEEEEEEKEKKEK